MRRVWLFCALGCVRALLGADQPQWGQAWSRNMISAETNLVGSFDLAGGKNVRWTARLGTETHSTPVVAGGRVLIGTNNGNPRDPRQRGDRGVLMCFDEKDGRFLWQLVVPKRIEDPYYDWPNSGLSSPATVEGRRVYVVSNRGEALCLDLDGMANGNDGPFLSESQHLTPSGSALIPAGPTDADILWRFDLVSGAGIWSHDAAHSSILVDGPYLYLNSGTGVDNTHRRIRTPHAPSLVVLDKATGRLVAREREHIAPDIFHSTWSAPSFGVVHGKRLVFLAAGNGILYAFEALPTDSVPAQPLILRKVWQFDFDPGAPKKDIHKYLSNRLQGPSNFYGMPVFYKHRIYLAGGGDVFWGKNETWLKCIDATQTGDVTRTALIWSHPLVRHTLSTPAIYDGLVFIADAKGFVHCLEAETGQPDWTFETRGEIWASPLVADKKLYIGTRRGDFWILSAGREKRLLCSAQFDHKISATATAANGVVYVATMNRLYALAKSP